MYSEFHQTSDINNNYNSIDSTNIAVDSAATSIDSVISLDKPIIENFDKSSETRDILKNLKIEQIKANIQSGGKNVFYSCVIISLTIMSLCFFLFLEDRKKEQYKDDDFKDNNLFYRYGESIYQSSLSMSPKDNNDTAFEISEEYIRYINKEVLEQYRNVDGFDVNIKNIKDLGSKSNDNRKFLKISFKTNRRSLLYYFIYKQVFGNQIIIYFYSHLKGHYNWYNVLSFITSSPIHIYFWIWKWIDNQYSVVNSISNRFDNSSFENIDIESIFKSLNFLAQNCTKRFAEKNNLMSHELEQVIIQNITNSQNVNISNSRGVRIGRIISKNKTK